MDKLYQHGVHGIPHKQIKSYLTSRIQQVKDTHKANNHLKGYSSSSLPDRYGVPQGSVLGLLLFILYVNDVSHLTQGRTINYAEDTSILNIRQVINELQKTSENTSLVEQYFEMNNLSINPTKIHYILFQTKQCRQESEYKILRSH
jgi:hypothetical protein